MGKKVTVGYKYYLGAHMALCHGPIDKLTAIHIDDKEAWTGESTGGQIIISKSELFGGKTREGGVSGTLDFEQGGSTQGVNSYLSGKIGALTPSFRGIAATVLRQVYIGNSPYLKKWAFRGQRIHVRTSDGLAQWQDSLSQLSDVVIGNWETYQTNADVSTVRIVSYSNGVFHAGGTNARYIRSTDNGATWSAGVFLVAGNFINDIRYANGVLILVGDAGRMNRSTDNGLTWSATANILTSSNILNTAYGNNIWHISGNSGKYTRSTDNGLTWSAPVNILSSANIVSMIYANGILASIGGSGLFTRSIDDGVTWSAPANILTSSLPSKIAYGNGVWIVVGASGKFTRSTDNGVTWSAPANILTSSNINDVAYSNGVWIVVGASGKFTRSTDDGVTWSAPATILSTSNILKIAYDHNIWVIIGTLGLSSRSFDNGVTWETPVDIAGGLQVNSIAYSNNTFIAGANSGRLNRFTTSASTRVDMNPAHIIRECLTDPDWGMGYPESDVDETSFLAAAQTLYNEDFGLSMVWATETTIESFISDIRRHIDAALYVDRTDGKFHLKLIRNDYVVGSLLELNTSNVLKIEGFKRPAFDELTNTVNVKFYDRNRRTSGSLSLNNIALVQSQGRIISESITYNAVCYNELAQRLALRDLKVLSYPLAVCVIYANREASVLNPGDVFKLNHSDVSATPIVMRVVKISYGDGKSTRVKIECAEDVFSLSDAGLIGTSTSTWTDPYAAPTPAVNRVVAEMPYYEMVQVLGQTNADNQLTLNEFAGYLVATAANPGSAINAHLNVDSGAGYEDVGTAEFCPFAQLTADITAGATTWAIGSGITLSEVRVGTYAQIDNELFRVDTITDTSVTVGRGVLDTVPTPHLNTAKIYFLDDYSEGDGTEYGSGTTINVKLCPVNGSGEVALSDATADPLTFNQRAFRPYPPGLFQVNGSSYPATLVGADVTLSWAHRDRTQQTGSSIIDQSSGNIGPEVGTTYTATLYNNVGGATLEQFTAIAGTSQAFTSLYGYFSIRAEVFSVRGGLNSWQTHSHVFDHWNHILLTEASDYLITEASDYIIEE